MSITYAHVSYNSTGLLPGDNFPLTEFVNGSFELVSQTLQNAARKFNFNEYPDIHKDWKNFGKHYYPKSDSVLEYMRAHSVQAKYPLKQFFYKDVCYNTGQARLASKENIENEVGLMVDWVKHISIYAVANASVRTSQNLNPPPPLTFLTASAINGAVLQYSSDSYNYYKIDLVRRNVTIVILSNHVKRMTTHVGKGFSSSGIIYYLFI
jgi:hypothetical protein